MARKLTQKQRKFAHEYLKTGNATLAVKKAYDLSDPSDTDTAGAMGSKLLGNDKIQTYIQQNAVRAAEIVYEIAEHGDGDPVRLAASKDILDRAGMRPVDKSMNMHVNIGVDELRSQIQAALSKFRS